MARSSSSRKDYSHDISRAVTSTEELSRILGLSRWTVSRAMHDNPKVKYETRVRVREAMREYGFTPSPTIRGLFGHTSGVVGVCMNATAIELPIIERKLSALQAHLSKQRKSILIEIVGPGTPAEEPISKLASYRVDGIVILNALLKPYEGSASLTERFGVPIVMIESTTQPGVSSVCLDRRACSWALASHLWDLGHRRVAFLSTKIVGQENPRLDGFHEFFKSKGLNPEHSVAQYHGPWEKFEKTSKYVPDLLWYGKELAETVLADPGAPRALHASNDYIAYGLIERLRERGYRVPEDFSVTGFDNSCGSAWGEPFLTTIDTNIQSAVEKAVSLLHLKKGSQSPFSKAKNVYISPLLKVRHSTMPPPF